MLPAKESVELYLHDEPGELLLKVLHSVEMLGIVEREAVVVCVTYELLLQRWSIRKRHSRNIIRRWPIVFAAVEVRARSVDFA